MLISRTTADFTPTKKVAAAIRSDLSPSGTGHLRKEFQRWLDVYRRFLRYRFEQEGNGEWPPLAASTLKRKTATSRRGASGRFMKAGIYMLRETDTLFNALTATPGGGPGWFEQHTQNGVEAGYAGEVIHPSGDVTIADLARYHYDGGPRLPSRKIVVTPDEETQDDMTDGLGIALGKIIADAGAD